VQNEHKTQEAKLQLKLETQNAAVGLQHQNRPQERKKGNIKTLRSPVTVHKPISTKLCVWIEDVR